MLLVFLPVNDAAGVSPPLANGCAAMGACATRGSGEPQLAHTELLLGLSVPQLSHLIVFGWAGGACMIRPASRALPSFKSAPHWIQVSAVAGLRVPQNAQWISAPAWAAFTFSASVTNFWFAPSSNCTFSGCGAPQFSQVFALPLLRVLQFGQVHSFST